MCSFSFNLYGFFAFLQRLKMTIRAIFTKTARDDRCKKSKNKVFKRFNMLKSVNNEREREREVPPKHCPIFALPASTAHFRRALPRNTARQIFTPNTRRKHCHAQGRCVKMTQSICIICFRNLSFFEFSKTDL